MALSFKVGGLRLVLWCRFMSAVTFDFFL